MSIATIPENCGLSKGVRAWIANGGKALTAITGGVVDYTPVSLEITGVNNYQVRVSWKAYYPHPNTRQERQRQAENQIDFIKTICATGKVKRIELSTHPWDLLATFQAPEYALPSKVLEILDYPQLDREMYVRPEDRAYLSRIAHTMAWIGIVAYMIGVNVLKMSAENAFKYASASASAGSINVPVGGGGQITIQPPEPTPGPNYGGQPFVSQHGLIITVDGTSVVVPATLLSDGTYEANNVNLPIVGRASLSISFATCSLILRIEAIFTSVRFTGTKSGNACRFSIPHGTKVYNVTIAPSAGISVDGGGKQRNDMIAIGAIVFVALVGIILLTVR